MLLKINAGLAQKAFIKKINAFLDHPFRSLMEGNFISNIAVFYRREVVEKVMFDESPILTGIEDYDFVIRVLAETKSLGRVNTVSAGILLHPNRSVNLEHW